MIIKLDEWHFGAPRPDGQIGHGYGNVSGGMFSKSAVAKQAKSYPYSDEDKFEEDKSQEECEDDDLDLSINVLYKLSNMINRKGSGHYRNDPSPGHDKRSFASSDNVKIEGLGSSQPLSNKTRRDDPQTKLSPYGSSKNRDTAIGGMKPTIYTMSPFKGTGTLRGWSSSPDPIDPFLDEPEFFLKNIIDNEYRPLKKSSRSIEKVFFDDLGEEFFEDDVYLNDEDDYFHEEI